jgi:hypothetical protein
MSFARMNRETLLKVADFFDINVDAQDGPKEIRLKLDDAGKTYDMWKRFNDPDESNVPDGIAFKQSNLLIKMTRQNPTFEVFGYRFTRTSPYRAVPADDAQRIMDMYDGFVIATPSEVKSFYDK